MKEIMKILNFTKTKISSSKDNVKRIRGLATLEENTTKDTSHFKKNSSKTYKEC